MVYTRQGILLKQSVLLKYRMLCPYSVQWLFNGKANRIADVIIQ